ncbi:hypothetical protein ES703_110053 [subsurface metagenome]
MNEIATKELIVEARDAFGEWISIPAWQWFVSLTFAKGNISKWEADQHWQAWLNSLVLTCKARGEPRPFYFRVSEFQKRGTVHYHVLIGGLGEIRRLLFKDLWEPFGFARILKYEPGKGANYYCGKYLSKTDCEMRFSHNLKHHLTKRRELVILE